MCRGKNACGRRPYCWSCGASGHISKACPCKNTTPQPRLTTVTVEAMEESSKASVFGGKEGMEDGQPFSSEGCPRIELRRAKTTEATAAAKAATARLGYGGGRKASILVFIFEMEEGGRRLRKGENNYQEGDAGWTKYGGEGHGQNQVPVRLCFTSKNWRYHSKVKEPPFPLLGLRFPPLPPLPTRAKRRKNDCHIDRHDLERGRFTKKKTNWDRYLKKPPLAGSPLRILVISLRPEVWYHG